MAVVKALTFFCGLFVENSSVNIYFIRFVEQIIFVCYLLSYWLLADLEVTCLRHCFSHAFSVYFMVTGAFVGMHIEHLLVGCELWHHVEGAIVCTEGGSDKDDLCEEVSGIPAWIHHPVADLHVAWLHCPHCLEGTAFELKQAFSIGGRSFWEDAELVPFHALVFDIHLSLLDFIELGFISYFVSASCDIDALKSVNYCADEWSVLKSIARSIRRLEW